ncbi:hypothetical protein [Daejeonella lutea]|uniref:Uncharacterized protein n=1 Tax=Daejeonella lutea TaxID=572036 RepID=A0A1T5AQC4_9SPHI|nr:hypothetical protein [Daejeonella lutea]SKB37178.1 hypothetical protein SAMN05661099_0939 [Daejeonella lutea]
MLKQKIKSIIFLLVVSAAISCSKDEESGPDSDTGGTGTKTPFIEYKIGTNAAVRVDCSEISFEARPNETVSGVIATSASTKASFSFAFPARTSEINKLSAGFYPIKAFNGTIHSESFHISLRVPKTPGGTDYYSSLEATGTAFKNEVKSIEKTSANGKQTSFVNGVFTLEGKNAAGDIQTVSGSYRFKLITID